MEAASTWCIWWLSTGSSLRLQMMPLVIGWLWGRTDASMALPDLYFTVKTLPMGDAASSSLLSSPLVKLRLSRSSTISYHIQSMHVTWYRYRRTVARKTTSWDSIQSIIDGYDFQFSMERFNHAWYCSHAMTNSPLPTRIPVNFEPGMQMSAVRG